MSWKRKLSEIEANLYKVPTPKFFRSPKGEVEYKDYDDGEKQLEAKFYGIKAPDGSMVELKLNGTSILNFSLKNGRINVKLSSNEGHQIPKMTVDDIVEIALNGTVMLQGKFLPDKYK